MTNTPRGMAMAWQPPGEDVIRIGYAGDVVSHLVVSTNRSEAEKIFSALVRLARQGRAITKAGAFAAVWLGMQFLHQDFNHDGVVGVVYRALHLTMGVS